MPSDSTAGYGQTDKIVFLDARKELEKLIVTLQALPRSRQMSLAITKLEEANHWLLDLQTKPF